MSMSPRRGSFLSLSATFYILSWAISIFSFENTVYSQSKNTKTVQNFSEPIKKVTCIVLVLLVLLVIEAAADGTAAVAADGNCAHAVKALRTTAPHGTTAYRGGGAWCCSQTKNLLNS